MFRCAFFWSVPKCNIVTLDRLYDNALAKLITLFPKPVVGI